MLDMIMTLPGYEGRGAGSAQIAWGLKVADEEGLAVVLESSPVARRFYEKYGFEVMGEVEHDLEPWGREEGEMFVHTFMVRPAQLQ